PAGATSVASPWPTSNTTTRVHPAGGGGTTSTRAAGRPSATAPAPTPMGTAAHQRRARRRNVRTPAHPAYQHAMVHAAGGATSSTSHGATSTSAADRRTPPVPASALHPPAPPARPTAHRS